jgi:hypothetical protein
MMNENDQVSCEIGKVVKVDRVRGNSKVPLRDGPVTDVKIVRSVCFLIKYLSLVV